MSTDWCRVDDWLTEAYKVLRLSSITVPGLQRLIVHDYAAPQLLRAYLEAPQHWKYLNDHFVDFFIPWVYEPLYDLLPPNAVKCNLSFYGPDGYQLPKPKELGFQCLFWHSLSTYRTYIRSFQVTMSQHQVAEYYDQHQTHVYAEWYTIRIYFLNSHVTIQGLFNWRTMFK